MIIQNIKFLALLSALVSCAPSLGAMKNDGGIKKKSPSVYTLIKPMVSSVYYFPKEEITTFGKSELDVFALCCALNLNFSSESDFFHKLDVGLLERIVTSNFVGVCKLQIFARPGIELKWQGNFDMINWESPDEKTVNISVRDNNNGRSYIIVGKLKSSPTDGGKFWHFYVKDLNTRENRFTKSLVNFKASDGDKDSYSDNLIKFRKKFRHHMLENIVLFLTRNKSFSEVKKILAKREFFLIFATYGGVRFDFNKSTLKLNKNKERSFEINFNNFKESNVKIISNNFKESDVSPMNLIMQLLKNNDGFWNPEVARIEEI